MNNTASFAFSWPLIWGMHWSNAVVLNLKKEGGANNEGKQETSWFWKLSPAGH